MKRLLAIIVLIVIITAAAIGAGSPTHPAETAAREPEFVPNQVDLYFPDNPTTGYSWSYDIEDSSLIEIREQYFEDSSDLGFVGGGGTQWFHISGLCPGTTSVTFRYLRTWEPDPATSETTYRLTVDDRLNVLIWGVEVS